MGAWNVLVNEWRILLSVVGSFGECVKFTFSLTENVGTAEMPGKAL